MQKTKLTNTGEEIVLLETRDLRIGNILSYKGELVHVTSLSLDIDDEYNELIGFCKLGESTNEHSDWNRAMACDLIPVNVSADLLIQFGFKQREYFLFHPEIDEDYRVTSRFFPSDVDQSSGNEWHLKKGSNAHFVDFKYLHELQNVVFVIAGKELNISQ